MLMYRNDFFDAKGRKVQEQPTYADIKKWAEALTDKEKGTHGITLRGKPGWGENNGGDTSPSSPCQHVAQRRSPQRIDAGGGASRASRLSTRMKAISEELCIHDFSASATSIFHQKLDEELGAGGRKLHRLHSSLSFHEPGSTKGSKGGKIAAIAAVVGAIIE